MMKNNLGIYIHIPFCNKKCDYCDFVSYCTGDEVKARYVDDLLLEVSRYRDLVEKANITTLYFGGGTPSALPPVLLTRLLEGLPPQFFQAEEITFEMNPESVTEEKLCVLYDAGINRISLGVQSLCDRTLKILGRAHTVNDVYTAVDKIRTAGFHNLNLDLIYAISEEHSVEDSILLLAEMEPEHVSTYPLEIYSHLPLSEKISPVEDEFFLKEFSTIERVLGNKGYYRYEVSNFSKPGFESKHNVAYWKRVDYLGLGVSAHSLLGSRRHSNVDDLLLYHEAVKQGSCPVMKEVMLTKEDEAFEMLMLGLRLTEGVDLLAYHTEYGEFTDAQKRAIERFSQQSFFERSEGRLALTPTGMNMMNMVLVELME